MADGKKRLAKLAAAMADAPDRSLPKQCHSWADLKAAYRLLNHPQVHPDQMTAVHRDLTRQQACQRPVILCVQDMTDLDYTLRTGIRGLGPIGNGGGRGFRQQTGLAVGEEGHLVGILAQKWFIPSDPHKGETRRQRQSRWNEPDVWGEIAQSIGPWPSPSRLIHVGDRHSDVFRFFVICRSLGHGFVVRAMHDRYLAEGDQLWERMECQAAAFTRCVMAGTQRAHSNEVKRSPRSAEVTVRYAPLTIRPPRNDPRTEAHAPISVWALYVREKNAPAGEEPLEWMLLTSEAVENNAEAERCLQRYCRRWKIEEWHRVLKEGCRLERSQLDDVEDLKRLAAMTGVVSVRLLQLRELADDNNPQSQDPAALRQAASPLWIQVVSRLSRVPAEQLTPRQFLLTIARRGGYLGRTSDGRPGWKTIWQGWYDIERMVEGVELMRPP